jgi:hypothetical protein
MEKLVFRKNPTKRQTELCVYHTWRTKCRVYAVQRSCSKFGLPTVWRAIDGDGNILSSHRTKAGACRSCQSHFNKIARGRRTKQKK